MLRGEEKKGEEWKGKEERRGEETTQHDLSECSQLAQTSLYDLAGVTSTGNQAQDMKSLKTHTQRSVE